MRTTTGPLGLSGTRCPAAPGAAIATARSVSAGGAARGSASTQRPARTGRPTSARWRHPGWPGVMTMPGCCCPTRGTGTATSTTPTPATRRCCPAGVRRDGEGVVIGHQSQRDGRVRRRRRNRVRRGWARLRPISARLTKHALPWSWTAGPRGADLALRGPGHGGPPTLIATVADGGPVDGSSSGPLWVREPCHDL